MIFSAPHELSHFSARGFISMLPACLVMSCLLLPAGCDMGDDGVDTNTADLCDRDGDQFENISCGGPDCNDDDATIHPDAEEQCDSVDHNCDGLIHAEAVDANTFFRDADQDGFGDPNSQISACFVYWPYVDDNSDCDDLSEDVNPDQVWYRDADNDRLGDPNDTLSSCLQPEGYVMDRQDPDDSDGAGLGCWSQVSVGRDFSCGLRQDSSVACWGSNAAGQTDIPASLTGTISISAGYNHACALNGDGDVTCWGGTNDEVLLPPDLHFTSISCGLEFCCGLTDDPENNLECWGENGQGQSSPPIGLFQAVSAGIGRHACGINSESAIQCWGVETGLTGQPSPIAPPEGLFTHVEAGYYYSCAIDENHQAVCFGANNNGQGTPPDLEITSIQAGADHTCAIDTVENIECWGNEGFNRLDDPIGNFLQLDTSHLHSCAMNDDFVIQCWGHDNFGRLFPATCQ